MRMTPQQRRALALLREDPDATLHELVDAADLPQTKASLSQAFVWRLIESGYLRITLTPQGEVESLVDAAEPRHRG